MFFLSINDIITGQKFAHVEFVLNYNKADAYLDLKRQDTHVNKWYIYLYMYIYYIKFPISPILIILKFSQKNFWINFLF